ncbi:protein lethal(2)k10201 isoform X2 [Vanessa atalanta]|nr:protein lethal(2)k10201 isoform X2 [Vanessa atalanta]XP_047537978.1 protein lethal(2)k10201 isoform X2 [Vanessa atalanta]XP_047537979.1 protein lethal(2)k10201 isoform X2 [Vanessa atalanta]XP_047537980.1 protein lethal(2)k10201 isoform X2 [Vanessa atalanta]XP_047537981.1 protein lethal(2)k10201 isoform X2 [Vanessa atalanta]
MEVQVNLVDKLKSYGLGRRRLDDVFFNDTPPSRLGIYDADDEELCHAMVQTTCTVPGCNFTVTSLLDYENHYNSSHRYSCMQCKKVLPSPHLLDLHIQEQHDSFFAVMAVKKPSYSCYIEECKEKFMNAEDRLNHCIKTHKLPKDFRFDQKPRKKNKSKKNSQAMEIDVDDIQAARKDSQKLIFKNSKQRGFQKYSIKKFTSDDKDSKSVNLDQVMADIKESLP